MVNTQWVQFILFSLKITTIKSLIKYKGTQFIFQSSVYYPPNFHSFKKILCGLLFSKYNSHMVDTTRRYKNTHLRIHIVILETFHSVYIIIIIMHVC